MKVYNVCYIKQKSDCKSEQLCHLTDAEPLLPNHTWARLWFEQCYEMNTILHKAFVECSMKVSTLHSFLNSWDKHNQIRMKTNHLRAIKSSTDNQKCSLPTKVVCTHYSFSICGKAHGKATRYQKHMYNGLVDRSCHTACMPYNLNRCRMLEVTFCINYSEFYIRCLWITWLFHPSQEHILCGSGM